jgi:hypothetical protein
MLMYGNHAMTCFKYHFTFKAVMLMFLDFTKILLVSRLNFRKEWKKLDFSTKQYFSVFLSKVTACLSNHAVCKIGLTYRGVNCD